MELELRVTTTTGRAEGYRASALEPLGVSGLLVSKPIVFELTAGGFRGATTLSGSREDCDRDLAAHLSALAWLSKANPSWRLHVEIDPDGGVLELQDGSFGDDDEDVRALLEVTGTTVERAERGLVRLYVSVRVQPDAHAHLIDLVTTQLPDGWEPPVTEASSDAIAIGFELGGDLARTIQLISILRQAWLDEGSLAQCLVELEAEQPLVRMVETLQDWSALERVLRMPMSRVSSPSPPQSPQARTRSVLRRGVAMPALGESMLTWVDEGQLRGLTADGTLWTLGERVELAAAERALWRRSDGTSFLVEHQSVIDVPLASGTERRAHVATNYGILITDTRGDYALVRSLARGRITDGVQLFRPNAMVGSRCGNFAYAACEVGGFGALVTLHARDLAWDYRTPWPSTTTITDLAATDTTLVAVGTADGLTMLYVFEPHTGHLHASVYVPCLEPQIVFADARNTLLTGRSPTSGRHDLYRVQSDLSVTSVMTAGIDTREWGGLEAVSDGEQHVLVFEKRGVFALAEDGLEALISLDENEVITDFAHAESLLAVFTEGPSGARAIVGREQFQVVELPGSVSLPIFEKTRARRVGKTS